MSLNSNLDFKCNYDLLELFNDKQMVKVCAPMVRYSKLQFRTLVREYGCDLCFTPMILADSFCQSEKARNNEFSTHLGDSPTVVQFAANTVFDFVGAAEMVSPYCSGVDLNCGCPQRWAKTQGIGSSMLDKPELISDLVRQCRNHISKPFTVSVKMRILPDIKKSVTICQQLDHCGVSFLTVHSRTTRQHSVGPVDMNALRMINESVRCPVIANGGVKSLNDALELQNQTGCKGVMAASYLLTNPALFTGTATTPVECVQKWIDICYNSTLNLDSLTTNLNPTFEERNEHLTFQCFHHHLVFMLEKIIPKHFRRTFNYLQTFKSVLGFLKEHISVEPNILSLDNFHKYNRLMLNYDNRNKTYLDLKNTSNLRNFKSDVLSYSCDLNDGQYFNSKKDVQIDDTCISSLFIDN